jgi:hypothetical protein
MAGLAVLLENWHNVFVKGGRRREVWQAGNQEQRSGPHIGII